MAQTCPNSMNLNVQDGARTLRMILIMILLVSVLLLGGDTMDMAALRKVSI